MPAQAGIHIPPSQDKIALAFFKGSRKQASRASSCLRQRKDEKMFEEVRQSRHF